MISCQLHQNYSTLYNVTLIAHRQLLSQEVLSALQSIESVHALLLVCLWPVPQEHHFDDPSWEYIGLAINSAMRFNCHKPLSQSSPIRGWKVLGGAFANDLNITTQHTTWLACFNISTQ